MEIDLLVERTEAGLKRAVAEGRTLGRPRDEEGCFGSSLCHAFIDGDDVAADCERSVVER